MKYNLVLTGIYEYGAAGTAYNEDGNVVARHFSSNLGWLEIDLLRDCNYDDKKDTYTKDWE